MGQLWRGNTMALSKHILGGIYQKEGEELFKLKTKSAQEQDYKLAVNNLGFKL